MTKQQAEQIIQILKQGMSHKSGHYHYGYIYLSYDKNRDRYVVKREDLSMNVFEAEISFEYYSEKEMLAYLQEYYKFDETINYFARYYKNEFSQFMKNNDTTNNLGNHLLTAQEVVNFIKDGKTSVKDVERWH